MRVFVGYPDYVKADTVAWDRNLLMDCIMGRNMSTRDAFVRAVEQEIDSNLDAFNRSYESHSPDPAWDLFHAHVRPIVRRFFERSKQSCILQQHRNSTRQSCLQARWQARTNFWYSSSSSQQLQCVSDFRTFDNELRRVSRCLRIQSRQHYRRLDARNRRELLAAQRANKAFEQQRICRRMSRTRIGPKRRMYGIPRARNPTAQQWMDYLSKPSAQGGCSASFEEYESKLAETIVASEQNELAYEDMNTVSDVQDDIARLRSYVLMAPKRRTVPADSFVLEVWWILLHPNFRVPTNASYGLGHSQRERAKVVNKRFFAWLTRMLTIIRRSGDTVLRWHRGSAAQLPKPVKPDPCASVRLVFILDPIGKGYFASMLARRAEILGPVSIDQTYHGCVKNRRRESAILTMNATIYRCVKIHDVGCLAMFHDQSHAFMSMGVEMCSRALDLLVLPKDRKLAGQRFDWACFSLVTSSHGNTSHPMAAPPVSSASRHASVPSLSLSSDSHGLSSFVHKSSNQIDVHPRVGGLPGDPLVVAVWVAGFQHTTDNAQQRLYTQDPHASELSVSLINIDQHCSLSHSTYVDDLYQLLLVSSNTAIEAVQKSEHWHLSLDAALSADNLQQNRSKNVNLPFLRGPNSQFELRYLFEKQILPGATARSARYLGPHISVSIESNTLEVGKRCAMMKVGFASFGKYWSSDTSSKHKRIVFDSAVNSHAYSGLVAFAWKESDSRVVDRTRIALLRRLMRGSAVTRNEDGDVIASMSNESVLKHWKSTPHFFELRILRIKQYQAWARFPNDYAQPLLAIFGRFPWETVPMITADGRINYANPSSRSPFLQQFTNDMVWLKHSEPGHDFLRCLKFQ